MISEYIEYQELEGAIQKVLSQEKSSKGRCKALLLLKEQYKSPLAQSRIDHYIQKEKAGSRLRIVQMVTGTAACVLFTGSLLLTTGYGRQLSAGADGNSPYTGADGNPAALLSETASVSDPESVSAEPIPTDPALAFHAGIADYQEGDFRNAIRKLTYCAEQGMDGFAVYQYLAEACYAEGNVSQAITWLTTYLTDIYGLPNVGNDNVIYQKLQTWHSLNPEAFSDDQAEILAQTAQYTSLYEEIYEKIQSGPAPYAQKQMDLLLAAGASSCSLWESYTYCASYDLSKDWTWNKIKSFVLDKDSYMARCTSQEERINLLNPFERCTPDEDPEYAEIIELENSILEDNDIALLGSEPGFLDPVTERDVNGMLKNRDKHSAYFLSRLKEYNFLKYDTDFSEGWLTLLYGPTCLEMVNTHRNGHLEMERTFLYEYRRDRIYTLIDNCPFDYEPDYAAYSQVWLNHPEVFTPEQLTGQWKLSTNNREVNITIDIRDVKNGPDSTTRALLSISGNPDGIIFPESWVTFTDNHCFLETDDWTFELMLVKQVSPAISDNIALMNVYSTQWAQDHSEGLYYRQ